MTNKAPKNVSMPDDVYLKMLLKHLCFSKTIQVRSKVKRSWKTACLLDSQSTEVVRYVHDWMWNRCLPKASIPDCAQVQIGMPGQEMEGQRIPADEFIRRFCAALKHADGIYVSVNGATATLVDLGAPEVVKYVISCIAFGKVPEAIKTKKRKK